MLSACSAPTAPTRDDRHVVLSGQSNAQRLEPALRAIARVQTVAEGGQPIALWNPDGPLWAPLCAVLAPAPQAFIWWQGETDGERGSTVYAAQLANLLQRVRATANTPTLRVVIVRVVPEPELLPIRLAEETWVAHDVNARLVNVDDLPRQPEARYHLSDESYATVAQRILAVLP